ncbi:MAG: hypothetical protein PHN39_01035 [Candidatus Pacebacteria bacterium]|nr:hypothetical protein [Candidatus Paceibacterota bacterium]
MKKFAIITFFILCALGINLTFNGPVALAQTPANTQTQTTVDPNDPNATTDPNATVAQEPEKTWEEMDADEKAEALKGSLGRSKSYIDAADAVIKRDYLKDMGPNHIRTLTTDAIVCGYDVAAAKERVLKLKADVESAKRVKGRSTVKEAAVETAWLSWYNDLAAKRKSTLETAVASVKSTADSAEKTAKDALGKAEGAVTSANGAKTTADSAEKTAKDALGKAEGAVTTANTSNSKALEAIAIAETAKLNAGEAKDIANEAKTAAGNVDEKINKALEEIGAWKEVAVDDPEHPGQTMKVWKRIKMASTEEMENAKAGIIYAQRLGEVNTRAITEEIKGSDDNSLTYFFNLAAAKFNLKIIGIGINQVKSQGLFSGKNDTVEEFRTFLIKGFQKKFRKTKEESELMVKKLTEGMDPK